MLILNSPHNKQTNVLLWSNPAQVFLYYGPSTTGQTQGLRNSFQVKRHLQIILVNRH